MNLHTADLTSRLSEYLSRRVPPKGIAGDEVLKSDQMGEYLRILRRFAPEGECLTAWWREFTDKLADEADTWAWPSPKDVAKAAKTAGSAAGVSGPKWVADSVAINLARLNKDEPIGEDWLWGAGALKLEAAGASRHLLRERRLQMAHAMDAIYPTDQVRAKLAELKARHESARDYFDEKKMGHYQTPIPKKNAFEPGEIEGLVE